jgi:D-alanine-D-alanine ligase
MGAKIRVGILFGGRSGEHEVSLLSAKNIAGAVDRTKYDVSLIAIDKDGRWLLPDQTHFLLNENDPKRIALNTKRGSDVALPPSRSGELANLSHSNESSRVDVIFPVLHGPFGEDGTVQGLLKLAGVPFVGADVLGSAVGMDKDVMKRLLRDAGIPIVPFLVYKHRDDVSFEEIVSALGLPFFVKPANLGSSVGVSKVKTAEDFAGAIEEAFRYDRKIIVETFIPCRELECAVLGNDEPEASGVGEIIPTHEFYSYDAKYIDENGATIEVPAKIPESVRERVRELAIRAFKALECAGLARVDCFLDTRSGDIYVNEINTLPGFTNISMYPKLWMERGISYSDLIDRLITLALERFEREQKLKVSRD